MTNLRNFGIIFAVSLVILGIIAIIACGYVADTVCAIFEDRGDELDDLLASDPKETTGIGNEGEDDRLTRPINGESFSWLMIVSDYRPSVFKNYFPTSAKDVDKLEDFGILDDDYKLVEATSIVLVHADVETREYVIMTFPTATKVDTAFGTVTLGELYAIDGANALSKKVSAMTGLEIDYYSVMHSSDLTLIANTIGSIECTVPVDIAYDGKNYVTLPEKKEEDTSKKPDTTKADKDEDGKDKEDKDETTEPETTYVSEIDRASSVRLAKKLMAALLYYDDTDGIDDEMLILQSFANGLMLNLSDDSDGSLTQEFSSVQKKMVKTNITKDDVLANAEVIRAYSWFKIQTLTYPGKFIKGKAGREGFYNPDIDAAISFFADYR